VRGKGDKERIVPYGEVAATALDRWTVQDGRAAPAGRPSSSTPAAAG
jgi:site-specific recombinase XerD